MGCTHIEIWEIPTLWGRAHLSFDPPERGNQAAPRIGGGDWFAKIGEPKSAH